MNLVLGSAQFGVNYGITNTRGQVSFEEVCRIFLEVSKRGVNIIDTSTQYGDSETAIGKASLETGCTFDIVTKTRAFSLCENFKRQELLKRDFENSRKKLNNNNIRALLFHSPKDLLSEDSDVLFDAVINLKTENPGLKIGVSVYEPDELKEIKRRYPIEVVQLPLNIFDRRFIPLIRDLENNNIEIYSRSTFLQGVLLDYESLPAFFDQYRSYFDAFGKTIDKKGLTRLEACIRFAQKHINNMVAGVVSLSQVQAILDIVKVKPTDTFYWDDNLFCNLPIDLIDPRLWKI